MEITGDTLREYLAKADREGFAVPAFNFSDIWDFLAIVEAAEEENAPVMLASNPHVADTIGVDICAAIGMTASRKAKVPLILHLDHSNSIDQCKAAIDNGYPSVMIDASKHPLEENIRIVREVVQYAAYRKTHVEAEIGRIKGRGYEGGYSGDDYLVKVDEAAELVRASGVDSLAVGIGTAHGFYEGKPDINFQRLSEVNRAVSIPLVLHGGTGIPEEDIRNAIKNGINKVNVGTIIHCTYMNNMREELVKRGVNPYTLDVIKPVKEKIREVVKGWIRVCGANGKV